MGATLTVNLDYDIVVDQVAAATLSTGTHIFAREARRLACTNRNDGVLICPFHHRIIHDHDWQIQFTDDIPEHLPLPPVDRRQRPRRHTRFTPTPRRMRRGFG